MSDKLNQSLDDILKGGRNSARANRGRRGGAKPQAKNPVGGVQKVTGPKHHGKPIATVPTGPSNKESKIFVSGLPRDINEQEIKKYFDQSVDKTKRISVAYGPNGQSRGEASITFAHPDGAAKAAEALNGIKIDGRPIKVEVVLSAKDAPKPVPTKPLSERIAKAAAKPKPKPATAQKATSKSTRGRGGKAARGGRRAPKSKEDLDAEMTDYFTEKPEGGAVQAPTGSMDVEGIE